MNSLVFVLVFNLWIWKIFESDFLIGIILVLTTFSFRKVINKCAKGKLFWIFFILLNFYQWQTTHPRDLVNLTNDEQRLQQVRLRGHPPVHFTILGKTVWIPTGNWLELRKESIVYYRLKDNFSQIVDPNLYFFAGHPRERVGVKEFEKFPYILLPAFLIGIFTSSKKSLKKYLPIILPVGIITYLGNDNPLGPFSLFPFIAVPTSIGIGKILTKVNKLPFMKRLVVKLILATLFALVFIQVYSYALH